MALSVALAVSDFDTRSIKAVKKRLQVRDYFFRNIMNRGINSPVESEISSGYNSIESTSTDTDSAPESLPKSQIEILLDNLLESVSESLRGLRADMGGETQNVCSEDFPKNDTESGVKDSEKDVLQDDQPLRLMYGNRDILNLEANLRKPMWPQKPKHDVEEDRKESGSVYFGKEEDDDPSDDHAFIADYSIIKCRDCSFNNSWPLFLNQDDKPEDSTGKSVKKPTTLCCGRKLATDGHDYRVICKGNK